MAAISPARGRTLRGRWGNVVMCTTALAAQITISSCARTRDQRALGIGGERGVDNVLQSPIAFVGPLRRVERGSYASVLSALTTQNFSGVCSFECERVSRLPHQG